ncbi:MULTISPECIES: FUSC family protein [unclassified Arthrobacter]|uniref:FUSC family protein n=1 Tax=unclassified Arthrobacter TaxID=235627 RepID=UPI00339B0BD9
MKVLEGMFTIGPSKNDHHPAIRCAIGIFVPLILLVVLGRLDLAIFASFGAFTGIYGRNEPHGTRLVLQLRAGLLMLLVMFLAALAGRMGDAWGLDGMASTWLLVLATTLVAGSCSVAISLLRLRPAGSLFHIFAFAAIASVPNQPPLGDGMLVAVLTTALALVIGFSARLMPRCRTPWTWPPPLRLLADERRATWLEGLGYLVAAGVAGSLATVAGQWLGFGHNYWAMVAAVVPLVGHTTRHRVSRGIQRIMGTILGLALLAGVLLVGLAPWQTVLVIAVCQFGAELFIARQYVLAQLFVTPLALISTLLVVPSSPGILLRDRIVETVIGAAVGVAVVLAPVAWRRLRRV